jgi:interleukin-1 receptor-associated kinase 4
VASALEYLHTGCEQVFVHRDVKSGNILLCEDWSAALGDYGVLRVQPSASTVVTTTVAGTSVYMAPEYIKGGAVSEKIDVYSFGVVLFELLLGATAHGPVPCNHDNSEGTDVVTFVEDFEGKVSSVLIGGWLDDVGEGVWSLAERCINGKRKKRPTSTEVHTALLALIQH